MHEQSVQIPMIEINVDHYVSVDGEIVMFREYGRTPNGNEIYGRWVLRQSGFFIDYNQYRFDMAAAHNLKLVN